MRVLVPCLQFSVSGKQRAQFPLLTALWLTLNFLIFWKGCSGCRTLFVFFPTTGLLSSEDLELAVGHLYRLSFLEEDFQSW